MILRFRIWIALFGKFLTRFCTTLRYGYLRLPFLPGFTFAFCLTFCFLPLSRRRIRISSAACLTSAGTAGASATRIKSKVNRCRRIGSERCRGVRGYCCPQPPQRTPNTSHLLLEIGAGRQFRVRGLDKVPPDQEARDFSRLSEG